MRKFENRVALFKNALTTGVLPFGTKGKDKNFKSLTKRQIDGFATILADMSFNVSDDIISFLLGLESHFIYKSEIRKQDICRNATRLCHKCQEPDCDLARGWKKE